MNYLKQFLIILSISFIGEILKALLPLPVPASIYGMAILFLCLVTGIIKLCKIFGIKEPIAKELAIGASVFSWIYSVL